MKSSRFGLTLMVVLVLTAALLAWFGPTLFEKTPKTPERDGQKSTVPTAPSEPAQLAAKGVVESAQEIVLSSRVKGELSVIDVDEGDQVATGQLLVRMNDRKVLAQIELAEARLRAAQSDLKEQTSGFRREEVAAGQSVVDRAQAVFEQAQAEAQRQERLLAKDASTRTEWEQAEKKRRVALAQLHEQQAQAEKLQSGFRSEAVERARAKVAEASAELNYDQAILADYSIHSPIDGLIIRRQVDANESVDIGAPLLTLIDPTQLRIHAEVEETDVGEVTEGQPVEVTVDNLPDKIFRGKVSRIFPTVDKKTQRSFDPVTSFDINTQKVYIALDNYTGLVHGMTVTVRFLK